VNQLTSGQVPTYTYEFERRERPVDHPSAAPLNAYHGSEMAYLFGSMIETSATPPFTLAQ
jgi:carboxylesterase type B